MKIGCWEVPKPTYPSLLWQAERKMPENYHLNKWLILSENHQTAWKCRLGKCVYRRRSNITPELIWFGHCSTGWFWLGVVYRRKWQLLVRGWVDEHGRPWLRPFRGSLLPLTCPSYSSTEGQETHSLGEVLTVLFNNRLLGRSSKAAGGAIINDAK